MYLRFFFSSRRRHTRWPRDWSSDVCSSDLDYLIAVDKPHFLPSIPSGQYLEHTAVARVRKHFNNYESTPLHRLHRETAGVMLFCVPPCCQIVGAACRDVVSVVLRY